VLDSRKKQKQEGVGEERANSGRPDWSALTKVVVEETPVVDRHLMPGGDLKGDTEVSDDGRSKWHVWGLRARVMPSGHGM
jgi:hypothetical protein